MLSSIRASLLLITLALVGCQAQSTYTMWMEDSNHQGPIGYFPTHFIGLKLDTNGYAYITAKSGDYATYAAVLSFASQYQTPDVFGGDYEFPFSFSSTGTYWVYATEYGTNYNYDWLEIRIVANSFSGTITPVYGTAPWFWTSGWPPIADPMLLGEHPEVPASQPAATNYTKWLVPLLVVVIVTALLVPVAMYIRRRRQQNKEMQATTAAQVENTAQDTTTTVQMTSV